MWRLLLVLAACTAHADAPALPTPNRGLTKGEIALLQPIFKDAIDYASTKVIDAPFPFQQKGVYMTPRGHLFAPGSLFRKDFSKDPSDRILFVHEMTHVWQFANGMDLVAQGLAEFAKTKGNYEAAYPYDLTADKDLVDYGMEQQASIVEDDYALRVEHVRPPRRLVDDHEDLAKRYGAVLAKLRADPKYARALDPKAVAASHGKQEPTRGKCPEDAAHHGENHVCSWRFQH